jgi:O-antigen/teichoic acid export membrane protein
METENDTHTSGYLDTAATPVEDLTRKALIGVSWSALSNVARQALSFLSIGLLARRLGPSVYGLMGMATLVLVFVGNFRDLGTATAIVQRPHVSHRLLSSLFWVNCGVGVVLSFAVYAAAAPISAFFHEPRLAALLRVISIAFFVAAVGAVPNAILVRQMAFDKIALADFWAALVGYAAAIACAYNGLGVWSLIVANLATFICTTALYFIFANWRPAVEFDMDEIRSVSSFSLNLAAFGFVNYFSRNADNIIIGRGLGPQALGYYQMAYNLFLYPLQNITSVVAQVLNPAFSRVQTENERFCSAYIRGCMLIGLITFPVMAGLGVVADPFVRVLLGEKWLPVVPLLQILVPVGMLQSVQGTVGQIYVAKGRTDWMFRFGFAAALLFVASFLVGIKWGPKGVAISYCCTYFLIVLYPSLRIPFSLIGLRVQDFLRYLLPQVAITLVMVGICLIWTNILVLLGSTVPIWNLISTVGVGIVSYVTSMLWLRPPVILHLEGLFADSDVVGAQQICRFLRYRGQRRCI